MAEQPHREVRHHPETGHIAINLDRVITGAGQRWLLIHIDDRGDVIATGLDDHQVHDWPQLTLDQGPDEPVGG